MGNARTPLTIFTALTLSIPLFGCVSRVANQRLDEKLSQEQDISSSQDLRREATHLIREMPEIDEGRKRKLAEIQDSARNELAQIHQDSLKLKAVLIQDVLTPGGYNEDEVNLIETRLRKLDRKRMDITTNAIRKANDVLGREDTRLKRVMAKELMFSDGANSVDPINR